MWGEKRQLFNITILIVNNAQIIPVFRRSTMKVPTF